MGRPTGKNIYRETESERETERADRRTETEK